MSRLYIALIILSVLKVPARAVDWSAFAQSAPAMPAAAPVETSSAISWRTSVFDAFVEAIESTKPLVILFVSDPTHTAADSTNAGNEQLAEFNRSEVQALAGQAVFVLCHYNWEKECMRDEFGERIRRHVHITDLPTTLVITPRTDELVEAARFERVHTSGELVQGLSDAFVASLKSVGAYTKTEAHEVFNSPIVNATTPEEAFRYYADAVGQADPYGVARVMIAPYSDQYIGMLNAAKEFAASKARFQQALDETFGPANEAFNLGVDFESISNQLRQYKGVSLQRIVSQTVDLAICEIRFEMVDGSQSVEVVEFGRDGDCWRMIPPANQLAGLSNSYDQATNQLKFMAMQLDLVTDQIRRGEIATGEAATTRAVDSCQQSAEIGG